MGIYYEAGPDFPEDAEGLYTEYGISQRSENSSEEHICKIIVYGDKELRGQILEFLNRRTNPENWQSQGGWYPYPKD